MPTSLVYDRLRNGLRLLRINRPTSPVVALDLWIGTGSACEEPGQAGLSHFLEHMLFKGTEHRTTEELNRMIEGVGGYWNAATSKDFTHYYIALPAEHTALGLEALADLVFHSTLNPEEFERERLVILEEWRRSEDNPASLLYERLYDNHWRQGPYKMPVLGTRETISSISRDQMLAYWRERYRPGNMALVLAGPTAGRNVINEVRRHFSHIPNGEIVDLPALSAQIARGATTLVAKDVQQVYLGLSWPAPPAEDLEAVVGMDVVQFILGQGRASRLYHRLLEERRLVTSISANYPLHHGDSIFTVTATCSPEKADEAREAIIEEVAGLARQGPGRKEMTRARRLLINTYHFGRETPTGVAGSVGHGLILTGDAAFSETYPERVERVTAAAVRSLAAQWLAPQAVNIVAIHPQNVNLQWDGTASGGGHET